jgi:hypothetical protein
MRRVQTIKGLDGGEPKLRMFATVDTIAYNDYYSAHEHQRTP